MSRYTFFRKRENPSPNELETTSNSPNNEETNSSSGRTNLLIEEFEFINDKMVVLSSVGERFQAARSRVSEMVKELRWTNEELHSTQKLLRDERSNTDKLTATVQEQEAALERLNSNLSSAHRQLDSVKARFVDSDNKRAELERFQSESALTIGNLKVQLNELTGVNSSLRADLEKALEKANSEEKIKSEINMKYSDLLDRYKTLKNDHQSVESRLNVANQRISDQYTELSESRAENDKLRKRIIIGSDRIKVEKAAADSLRTDNDQLLKEREEIKIKNESQIEAVRSRYKILEKMLEESRERYRAEISLHTSTKKEKAELEHEMTQNSAKLAGAREEATDLRARLIELSQEAKSANELVEQTQETSRKKELEIERLNEEVAMTASRSVSLENELNELREEQASEASRKNEIIAKMNREINMLREELQLFRGATVQRPPSGDELAKEGSNIINLTH